MGLITSESIVSGYNGYDFKSYSCKIRRSYAEYGHDSFVSSQLSLEKRTHSFYHLIKWTLGHMKNAAASLRRLAMLRLPVLCCHHLAYIEWWTVRCLLLSCSLPFPLFLFHALWPFVFPFLSFSLICLFCMLYWIKTILFYSIRCACWIFLLTLQWITNTIEDYANYRQ